MFKRALTYSALCCAISSMAFSQISDPAGATRSALPVQPVPAIDVPGPPLFTAIQEQLGLKLTPGKGPVEVIAIDSVEKATVN